MSFSEVFSRVWDHYDKHEAKYKYLVFPVMWVLSLYLGAFLFYRFVLLILAAVEKSL